MHKGGSQTWIVSDSAEDGDEYIFKIAKIANERPALMVTLFLKRVCPITEFAGSQEVQHNLAR